MVWVLSFKLRFVASSNAEDGSLDGAFIVVVVRWDEARSFAITRSSAYHRIAERR